MTKNVCEREGCDKFVRDNVVCEREERVVYDKVACERVVCDKVVCDKVVREREVCERVVCV